MNRFMNYQIGKYNHQIVLTAEPESQAYMRGWNDGIDEITGRLPKDILKSRMCDSYCRFAAEANEDEDLEKEHCSDCPLNQL